MKIPSTMSIKIYVACTTYSYTEWHWNSGIQWNLAVYSHWLADTTLNWISFLAEGKDKVGQLPFTSVLPHDKARNPHLLNS